jgi:hypothetical protein
MIDDGRGWMDVKMKGENSASFSRHRTSPLKFEVFRWCKCLKAVDV